VREGLACGGEVVGEHEGITCHRFEAKAKVGGGRRRIIGVQGLEPRGERTAAARVPCEGMR